MNVSSASSAHTASIAKTKEVQAPKPQPKIEKAEAPEPKRAVNVKA